MSFSVPRRNELNLAWYVFFFNEEIHYKYASVIEKTEARLLSTKSSHVFSILSPRDHLIHRAILSLLSLVALVASTSRGISACLSVRLICCYKHFSSSRLYLVRWNLVVICRPPKQQMAQFSIKAPDKSFQTGLRFVIACKILMMIYWFRLKLIIL